MKIYLAPMEGVVDPVIRELYSKIGGYDQMTTEFVRVTQHLNSEKTFKKYCPELNNGGKTKYGTPVYIQLLGGDPSCIAENAGFAESLGAPGIDLNFGCPAKKVNNHDGGAALLQNPTRLYDVITAVKRCVRVPVTAKVRLGFKDKSLHKEIALAVKQAEADLFTIHARTKIEGYKPPAHWEYIATMREIASPITTVANGEIWSVNDYKNCATVSGCKHISIGRGAFADPWLALKIKDINCNSEWVDYKDNVLPQFIELCASLYDESYAVRRLKQWTKFLARNFKQADACFNSIKRQHDLNAIKKILNLPPA